MPDPRAFEFFYLCWAFMMRRLSLIPSIHGPFELMDFSIEYVDPSEAPQVFMYLIHKDFENAIFL